MNTLTILGVASNSLGSLNTSSFAVQIDDKLLLVDCGPDTPRQAVRHGIRLQDVDCVILTHRHLDHCLGLPYFLFGRNLEVLAAKTISAQSVPKPLTIVGEKTLTTALLDLFKLAHPDVPTLSFSIQHIEIETLGAGGFNIGEAQVCFYTVDHAVPTYGFTIKGRLGKLLAYSSDTLPSPTFIEAAAKVPTLIHEAMVPASEGAFSSRAKHSTTVQAGNVIRDIQPNRAFLIHIRPSYWGKREELEREASKAAGLNVVYPEEGAQYLLE
jgi:ribonuclease BN (tRNA processing enzyme)